MSRARRGPRYWFHGDVSDDGAAFFDARADAWIALNGTTAGAWTLADLARLKHQLRLGVPKGWSRPADAPNILTGALDLRVTRAAIVAVTEADSRARELRLAFVLP